MIGTWKLRKRIALSGGSLIAAGLCTVAPAYAQNAGADPQATAKADAPAPQADTPSAPDDTDIVVTGTSIRGVPPAFRQTISAPCRPRTSIGVLPSAAFPATLANASADEV